MGQEVALDFILNSNSLLIMLMVPSLAVGILLILLSYRLINKIIDEFGKPFITAQQSQAATFIKIAEQCEATRITLSALADKIDNIDDKVEIIKRNVGDQH